MTATEFETFVLEHQERALRVAHTYLGDWEEARDAVQEAFVKTYRKIGSFRGESSVDTWFLRVLSNHCKDRLRRRKVRSWLSLAERREAESPDPLAEHPDPNPGPGARSEGRAFRLALRHAVARLPRRQREVFRLKVLAELTLAETAAALGISTGAAKAHLFRATRTLQEALAGWKDAT